MVNVDRPGMPRDIALREEALSKVLRQTEKWEKSEADLPGHVKVVTLTGTGFSVWVFRLARGYTPPHPPFAEEEGIGPSDGSGSLALSPYRGRLQTPNVSMHISDDEVEELVEVTGRTTLELSAKLLARFFKVAANPCSDCGMFSSSVQRYDVTPEGAMLCQACALSFVSGISVLADCAICLEPMVRPFVTDCNHLFHRKCLVSHLATSCRCPLCRADWLSEDEYNRRARPYTIDLVEYPLMEMPRNSAKAKRRRIKRPRPPVASD